MTPHDPVTHHRNLWAGMISALNEGRDAEAVALSHQLPPVRLQLQAELDAIRWTMPTEQQQLPEVIARYEDLSAEMWHGFTRIVTADAP